MGEKSIQGALFSIFSRIGIVPKISLFTRLDLGQLFAAGSFPVIENERLSQTSNQYFMVSKKIGLIFQTIKHMEKLEVKNKETCLPLGSDQMIKQQKIQ